MEGIIAFQQLLQCGAAWQLHPYTLIQFNSSSAPMAVCKDRLVTAAS